MLYRLLRKKIIFNLTHISISSSKPRCIAVIITPGIVLHGIGTRTTETTTTIDTGTDTETMVMATTIILITTRHLTGMNTCMVNQETILILGKEMMNQTER